MAKEPFTFLLGLLLSDYWVERFDLTCASTKKTYLTQALYHKKENLITMK